MGLYIGVVELVHNRFVNFRLLAEIQGQQIEELTPNDYERLFPYSPEGIIFLGFWSYLEPLMGDFLKNNSLMMFEFEFGDLEENYQNDGSRNPIGYKVSTPEMLERGKLRAIDGLDQVYYAVRETADLGGDIRSDSRVFINFDGIYDGCQVLVEQKDGFWTGPFEVGFRSLDSKYYIRPNIENGLLRGYQRSDLNLTQLGFGEKREWHLAQLKKNSNPQVIDVISDKDLIDALLKSVGTGATNNGLVNISALKEGITHGNSSVFSDPSLPLDIRQARAYRVRGLLEAEIQNGNTLGELAEFVCNLLIRFKDSDSVEGWLQALIMQNPDFLNQFQNMRIVNQHLQHLKEQAGSSVKQIKDLEQIIYELKKQRDEIEQTVSEEKERALSEQEQTYADWQKKIEELKALYAGHITLVQLDQKKQALDNDIAELTQKKNDLLQAVDAQQSAFQKGLDNVQEKMVNLPIDGFVASRMQVAAAQWENAQSVTRHDELVSAVNELSKSNLEPQDLVDYLYENVKAFRPKYNKNEIVNIAICMTQGFLTVFSGEPGCGKTSICDIFGEVLGLSRLDEKIDPVNFNGESPNRYLPVSVERGWTSKRDFIGYYNPLTKSFDKSNRKVFDALHQLSTEKKNSQLPYIILLDEANLSPMEYYWSDFMNLCDNLSDTSSVNLGEDFVFYIPETLHFVATINNDHTTENLSPRLTDRAWIITLPQDTDRSLAEHKSPIKKHESPISWSDLRKAFIDSASQYAMPQEVSTCYNDIVSLFKAQRISISPRIDRAIKRYWQVASQYFENDENQTSAEIVALDYAIAQRILPKILGNGDAFEEWLKKLKEVCQKNNLRKSEKIVEGIIHRGKQQMMYYQFFN